MSSDARERLKQRAEAALARAKEYDVTCPPIAASEREFVADVESVLGETAPPDRSPTVIPSRGRMLRKIRDWAEAPLGDAMGYEKIHEQAQTEVLALLDEIVPPEEDPSLCTVTIKKDGDDFVATDSETESEGYGKSYPDALVALAGEMGKVGEGCLSIMEDWAREEIEAMGKHALKEQCPRCNGSGVIAKIDEMAPPTGKEAAVWIMLLKKADHGGAGPCEIGRGDLHDIVQFLEGLGSVDPPEDPHQTPTLQAKTKICPDCGEVHKLVTCPDCGGNSFACLDCLKKTYEALSDPVKNSDG